MAKKAQTNNDAPVLEVKVPTTLKEWVNALLLLGTPAASVILVVLQSYGGLTAQNASTNVRLASIENGVMLLNKRMDRVEDVLIGERAAKAATFPDPALSFHDGLAWWER